MPDFDAPLVVAPTTPTHPGPNPRHSRDGFSTERMWLICVILSLGGTRYPEASLALAQLPGQAPGAAPSVVQPQCAGLQQAWEVCQRPRQHLPDHMCPEDERALREDFREEVAGREGRGGCSCHGHGRPRPWSIRLARGQGSLYGTQRRQEEEEDSLSY